MDDDVLICAGVIEIGLQNDGDLEGKRGPVRRVTVQEASYAYQWLGWHRSDGRRWDLDSDILFIIYSVLVDAKKNGMGLMTVMNRVSNERNGGSERKPSTSAALTKRRSIPVPSTRIGTLYRYGWNLDDGRVTR
jgi:hypothetical protein